MKKRILSVLISGVLLFGTVFANAVSISFEDLKQNNDESSIYFEDLEQSDKTSDLEETQIPESKNTEIVSENNILEANEADSYIDEYYFPEATDESIQTLSLDSYNVMTLNDSETIHGYFTSATNITAFNYDNHWNDTHSQWLKSHCVVYKNTSPSSDKYVLYENCVKTNSENGKTYDLIIQPFRVTANGIITTSNTKEPNTPILFTAKGKENGFKIIVTEHGNINKPVKMKIRFGFSDLEIAACNCGTAFGNEYMKVPASFVETHKGTGVERKDITQNNESYYQYIGKGHSNTDQQCFDTACVIGDIDISENGIIIHWGSTGSCLNPSIPDGGSHHCPKSSLSFSSIADYWGEDILPEIKYTHTLSYNANGGSNAPSSSTVTNTLSTYGMTVSSSVPTRTGYTFAGWNTNSSGTETNYSAGNSVSVGANATVTLYAKWTPITYSSTYNGNGNTGGSTASQTKTYNVAINLQSNGFTKTGYHFTGWNTAANGTGTSYSAGASYSSNANLALYAKWTINSSTLSVNPNGGTWNNSTATQNFTQNYNTTKSIPVPTRNGYTFVKWNRSGTNGTMTSLTGSSTYTFGASNGTTDTLTAEWKANNYTVTYIDVIDSKTGRELGRSTASKPYNSTARGSDKGSSKTDNAYYNGYYYDSDTSATVTTSGATVYRIFKQRMNTIAGNIIWEDWNNKNLSRPGNVNLYIKGSDGKTYSYVITGNHSQNTSVNRWPYSYNLPKYDSNGNVIVYTVSQDRAISQEKGLSYQEPLINGYDITNKITNMIINTEDYFQIPVTITWDDENDFYGFRPETATIQLLRNGEVIKTADVSDSYTFTELLKYDENGDKYVYTIQASDEKRYTKVENNSAPYNKTVTYTFVNSYFSVLIPKVIVLDGIGGNANYDITVNGAFYYNDTLTVKPATSFIMTDRNSISSMKANVLQSKQSFTKEDGVSNGSITNGSIQVDRTNFAGLWKGTFNFDIKFFMQN